MCEICSKLTIKAITNGKGNDVNSLVLVSLLLTLNIFHTFYGVPLVEFEKVDFGWNFTWIKKLS